MSEGMLGDSGLWACEGPNKKTLPWARICVALLLASATSALFGVFHAPTAAAAPARSAGLTIHSFAAPTVFSESSDALCLEELSKSEVPNCDVYQVTVTNSGSETVSEPISILDELPATVQVQKIQLLWSAQQGRDFGVRCQPGTPGTEPLHCAFPALLAPDQTLEVLIYLTVEPGAVSGEGGAVTVSEGERLVASTQQHDTIGAPASFGPTDLTTLTSNFTGQPDTTAGAHPYELSTRLDFNSKIRVSPTGTVRATSVEDVKDAVVDLPLGMLGSALATPKCTFAELASLVGCPKNTLVGHIISEPESVASVNSGIFNVVPEHGVAAEFGYTDVLDNTHVIYSSVSPTSAGYVLRATTKEIPQTQLTDATATFYGNPVEKNGSGESPAAFLTNPSDCSGAPLITHMYADSWQHPGALSADGAPEVEGPGWTSTSSESPPVTGCNALRFEPSGFTFKPDTTSADSPTGMSFDLKIPQSEQPETLATPPLKRATVKLPVGVVVNASSASGLTSCSTSQIGWKGGSVTNFTAEAPTCPDASKIGSIEVTTPLLAGTLTGSIYLAAQDQNPFHSLLAGYIVIDDPTTGTIAKIAGKLELDEHTGQITGTFDENPQLPFSDLKLRFFGGTRGELSTPENCETFTTTGELEPWSAPDSGPNAQVSDSFPINTGCVSGFSPAFSAGTTSPQAGSYSPFTLSFSRQDNEQELSGLSVSLPPGLEGKIAGVAECPEADIAAAAANPSGAAELASPSCPAASQIGSVQASAGTGSEPFSLTGTAYLTGPYKGGPYGIAFVVPAVAGPFDLGTVVVRSSLQIEQNDAHVTVTSDPFPTIIDHEGDGFPIRMRSVTASIDRAGFTLNPTNCNAMAINASFTSTGGATVPGSSRFQVGGCRELPFHPGFSVSTQAKTSKASGASLSVKVTSGSGQANIGKAKVTLPKQLPSRLTTLQKACLAAVFAANPAACPPASLVGTAVARTPLLSNPLVGPAYIVSHGGEKFPDLEVILQGEGITLLLDGNTNIKKGITTSTFNTVPDAPVSDFELTLPEGPHSILASFLPAKAKYSMCGQSLTMPTTLTGQNGAVVNQTTKIAVTGCPKKVKAKKSKGKKTKARHAAKKHK